MRQEKFAEFERVFGPVGVWQRIVRQSEAYLATDVTRESDERCRVRDFWSGHRGFERFRERFAEDIGRFDGWIAEELVEKQEFVGAYYEADGDDLVPA